MSFSMYSTTPRLNQFQKKFRKKKSANHDFQFQFFGLQKMDPIIFNRFLTARSPRGTGFAAGGDGNHLRCHQALKHQEERPSVLLPET